MKNKNNIKGLRKQSLFCIYCCLTQKDIINVVIFY